MVLMVLWPGLFRSSLISTRIAWVRQDKQNKLNICANLREEAYYKLAKPFICRALALSKPISFKVLLDNRKCMR